MSASPATIPHGLQTNQDAFVAALLQAAAADPNLVVVTSDSRGSGKLAPFASAFPERLIEVGIAEQNLVGVAAGLASCGRRVFAVSPSCFLSARALEQIKNDVAYSGHPVALVGISAGASYGALGLTHHSLHDLAVLRAIPGITILVPADRHEAAASARFASRSTDPVFIRLGKKPMPELPPPPPDWDPRESRILKSGSDLAFIACGETVSPALEAARELARRGVSTTVCSMPCPRPLDTAAVLQLGRAHRVVVTVEEHSVHGGLGEGCAAVLLQAGVSVPFRVVGFPDQWLINGSQADLFQHYGMDAEGLCARALEMLTPP